jgi:hypothetical protein
MQKETLIPGWPGSGDGTPAGVRVGRLIKRSWLTWNKGRSPDRSGKSAAQVFFISLLATMCANVVPARQDNLNV